LAQPVVEVQGTLALISVSEMTLNVAVVPLKATLVVPFKLLPRMITGILHSACGTEQLDRDTCDVHLR